MTAADAIRITHTCGCETLWTAWVWETQARLLERQATEECPRCQIRGPVAAKVRDLLARHGDAGAAVLALRHALGPHLCDVPFWAAVVDELLLATGREKR